MLQCARAVTGLGQRAHQPQCIAGVERVQAGQAPPALGSLMVIPQASRGSGESLDRPCVPLRQADSLGLHPPLELG
jgi:hypothetical protein